MHSLEQNRKSHKTNNAQFDTLGKSGNERNDSLNLLLETIDILEYTGDLNIMITKNGYLQLLSQELVIASENSLLKKVSSQNETLQYSFECNSFQEDEIKVIGCRFRAML